MACRRPRVPHGQRGARLLVGPLTVLAVIGVIWIVLLVIGLACLIVASRDDDKFGRG